MKVSDSGGMKNKTDIKIFILFLLDNIAYPLDYTTIHDISVQNGFVGDFDFAECFSELSEQGHIIEDEIDGEKYYAISSSGRMVSSELQSKIIAPIRERSLKSAMRLLSFKKSGASATCTYSPDGYGKYVATFTINEMGREVMKLDFTVSSELMAKTMKEKFDRSPEGTYRGILAVLTGELEYLLD